MEQKFNKTYIGHCRLQLAEILCCQWPLMSSMSARGGESSMSLEQQKLRSRVSVLQLGKHRFLGPTINQVRTSNLAVPRICIRHMQMFLILNYVQGRKWLFKSLGASSNMAAMVARHRCRRHLLFCQKVGGQLPPLPLLQLRPCHCKQNIFTNNVQIRSN